MDGLTFKDLDVERKLAGNRSRLAERDSTKRYRASIIQAEGGF
jgi:hypothetical protein